MAAHGHCTTWFRFSVHNHHRGVNTGRTRNATEGATAEVEKLPPDVTVMRADTRPLLAEDAGPLAADELATVISTLRRHIRALIPDVEQLAGRQPEDDIPRACALACCGEARIRLRLSNEDTPAVRGAAAQRLARSVIALCDHYENLGSPR